MSSRAKRVAIPTLLQFQVQVLPLAVHAINQLYSIIAGTQKVATIILKDHIQGCVKDAIVHNNRSDDFVNELIEVVERYTKR